MTVFNNPAKLTVAVSISDSLDIEQFGLGEDHLKEAMSEFALYLLSTGMNLAYSGDVCKGGFAELLVELLSRYRIAEHIGKARVTNYFAWPVHVRMPVEDLKSLHSEFGGSIQYVLLDCEGDRMSIQERSKLLPQEPSDNEWLKGLTTMRKIMCKETHARILVGGRVEDQKGSMPGIAEEALLSFRRGQALFLLGGFGGCTRDILKKIGLLDSIEEASPNWEGQSKFEKFTVKDLKNGLSLEQNQVLAETPFIDQAITLVLHGLRKLQLNSLG